MILAGGRAHRMGGRDKALLLLDGRPLLARVLERLAPQVTAVAISANGDPARFAAFNLPVLADPTPGQPGPLAGILAGVEAARARGFAHVLTVPTDTPFVPHALAESLQAAAGGEPRPAVAASWGRRHPTIALWPVTAREAIVAALARGEHRVGAVARMLDAATADHGDVSPDPFQNLNTPADLAAASRPRQADTR